MTTLLLSLLLIGSVVVLPMALARPRRGGVLSRRAVAVAALGGRDLRDVETYTQDCAMAARLLMAYRGNADPVFVRRILRDVVTQLDSVQRATRLRGALGSRPSAKRRRFYTWPDFLLWLAGIVDADVVARLIAWRGDDGIVDLEQMSTRALESFRATVDGADEAFLLTLFEEELVRMGLLGAEDFESDPDPCDLAADEPDDEPVRS